MQKLQKCTKNWKSWQNSNWRSEKNAKIAKMSKKLQKLGKVDIGKSWNPGKNCQNCPKLWKKKKSRNKSIEKAEPGKSLNSKKKYTKN